MIIGLAAFEFASESSVSSEFFGTMPHMAKATGVHCIYGFKHPSKFFPVITS